VYIAPPLSVANNDRNKVFVNVICSGVFPPSTEPKKTPPPNFPHPNEKLESLICEEKEENVSINTCIKTKKRKKKEKEKQKKRKEKKKM
jgi:hypothetical protein